MEIRKVWARALIALIAAATALGIGFSGSSADATGHHPTKCGYVEVGKDGSTTTETIRDYCDGFECSAESFGPESGGMFGISWEIFVCTVET